MRQLDLAGLRSRRNPTASRRRDGESRFREEPHFDLDPAVAQDELPLPAHELPLRKERPAKRPAKRKEARAAKRVPDGGRAEGAARYLRTLDWRRGSRIVAAAFVLTMPVWLWQAGHLDDFDRKMADARAGVGKAFGLKLTKFDIDGVRKTSVTEFRRALAVRRGVALLEIDLARLRNRIEALPWVAEAVVERRLPDTLSVRVRERVPLVRWRHRGRTVLVDSEGVAIRVPVRKEYQRLALISGAGAPSKAGALLQMLESRPELQARIVEARRVGRRRWDIVFGNGVVLMLPEKAADAAWERFAALEARRGLLNRGLVAIDLRLGDRIVLRAPGPVPKPLRTSGGRET